MRDDSTKNINGKSEWHGQLLGFGSMPMGEVVAKSQAEWEKLWEFKRDPGMPYEADLTPGALPDGMMAVAVFPGIKSETGHLVEITDVKELSDRIVVEWDERPPRGASGDAFSSPYVVKLLPHSDKPVKFEKRPPNGMDAANDFTYKPPKFG